MIIKSSTTIRNDYNSISKLCKETSQPIYLTKNGEGDLVIMDIAAFERREKNFQLKSMLLEAELARLNGAKTYSLEEMRKIIVDEKKS